MVNSKFSFIFYIFVRNYLTKNCLYEFFLEESILMLVMSLVLTLSCHFSSYLVGVFSEKSLVRIDECLLEEFYNIFCFLKSNPYKSTFLLLIVSSLDEGSLMMRLELL